ncbi:glycoside hydrolase family 3 C-terminal domain-containing protein [Actinoplanes sp. KI2]|uniref:glycoside hydrolase family 3 C-terminal domain-containing protein n=1 Tax=Actinoplanes sp. KI2 TaxID=2983315 RepID=UPI0021D58633|nr:glycoside hydrolase family 3 C-terminal domain-containing protein [Actinoplanes sp. KI2]MCU7727605.1 glycoside hydrolase family 3 C-terminal domain-containing protein [Actinoplanes sp. KI2]
MELNDQAVITSGSDFWSSTAAGGVPAITLTDGPHGVRLQVPDAEDLLAGQPATCFPPAVASGSTWDPGLLRRMGEALAEECRAMGVQVLLGPGINLKRTPLGGRNFEYFSEDPLVAGVLAAGWVQGLQSGGVGASLKHFAVNSQETDRMRISADVDERSLRELYLRAFQRVVTTAQPWTVMCSYNRINGVYASQNRWLLTDVLRDEWGFEGLVVSDWGAVVDRVEAVRAGLDLTMPGPDPTGDQALIEAVGDGRLPASTLAQAADRVRALVDRTTAAGRTGGYDADRHHALAREIAARGIVLLKNEGDLLPLGPDQTVAVVGELARTPRYQGGGSSQMTPTRLDDALTAIEESAPGKVRFTADPAEAVELARTSDVAVVFAGTEQETEGSDRASLDLPADQLRLIAAVAAANPRTVVVLSNGAVVLTTPWDRDVAALLEGWLLGQAGGSATADVLYGRVNPSGRLTETIPLRLEDHPSYLDCPGEAGHVRYGEGIHVGYRGFDARKQEVAYPFGFGLSYTTFSYAEATATASEAGVDIRLRVTNTGSRDGREVVQAYVSLPSSRVRRAPRELKAFAGVEIRAGETAEVLLHADRSDLAYWDVVLQRWVVEDGTYTIEVGASSRDIRATTTVAVPGDEGRHPLTADSTIGEWLADPRGAEVLTEVFTRMATEGGGGMAATLTLDPAMLQMAASFPLSRMAMFPGSPFTTETLAGLVVAANK